MLSKVFLLLLATTSLGRAEGTVVAEHGDLELHVLEERCKGILRQAAKARCSNGSRERHAEELGQVRRGLAEKSRILKKEKKQHGYIRVEMVLAGLKAFENVENMDLLINEYAATDTWQLMMELVMYSLQLDYLNTLSTGDPEEESARTALVKYVVQQVPNPSVSLTDISEEAKELIDGYLAQMQAMVMQFDSTLNLPSPGILLAKGASKSINESAALAGGDGPEVLRMDKKTFKELDRGTKIKLTEDLTAKEWNKLLENFWIEGEDNAAILFYTLDYKEERRLKMFEEALKDNLKYLFEEMCDLAYVPRTPQVIQLLDWGLGVYPHLRHLILSTIYQLEHPVTKWYLDDPKEDWDLLKELIERGWIKREAIADQLEEIVTLYPPKILKFLISKHILTKDEVCAMDLYRKVWDRRGKEYLKWAKDQCGLEPDQGHLDAAVSEGREDVVKFMAEDLGVKTLPRQTAVNEAASNGMLALLRNKCPEWKLFPDTDGANGAARNGHLEVLKWLAEREIYPDLNGANGAAENGQLEVLEWLATLEPESHRVCPSQYGANQAAHKGHLKVLKWLAALQPENRRVYPNQYGANWAAASGHLKVLKWLKTLEPAKRRACPNLEGVNWAAAGGHLKVLKWLAEHRAYPDQHDANLAAGNGHLEVLKWLAERRVYPNQTGADWAAASGHLGVLKWLATLEPEELRIYPTQDGADRAAEKGHLRVVKWLTTLEPEGQRVYPSLDGANWAAGNGHLDVVEWLATLEPELHRVYPNQDGASCAVRNGHPEVFEWLRERELIAN